VAGFQIEKTPDFDEWFSKQDLMIRTKIEIRFNRIINDGHFGTTNRFDGIIELKWKSGLRIYTSRIGRTIIIALGGGNKNGQSKDIKKAKKILEEIRSRGFESV
jgi:putative addiction module killer protein